MLTGKKVRLFFPHSRLWRANGGGTVDMKGSELHIIGDFVYGINR